MRDAHECLVVVPPVLDFLLPERVLPDNDRSYSFCDQEIGSGQNENDVVE